MGSVGGWEIIEILRTSSDISSTSSSSSASASSRTIARRRVGAAVFLRAFLMIGESSCDRFAERPPKGLEPTSSGLSAHDSDTPVCSESSSSESARPPFRRSHGSGDSARASSSARSLMSSLQAQSPAPGAHGSSRSLPE